MLETVEEFKRKPIELNLAAAKKRKSAQTGFIHYYPFSLPLEPHDTIPLYENFCYALALLRSRLSDHVLEAKSLLTSTNIPIVMIDARCCIFCRFSSGSSTIFQIEFSGNRLHSSLRISPIGLFSMLKGQIEKSHFLSLHGQNGRLTQLLSRFWALLLRLLQNGLTISSLFRSPKHKELK